jgi:AAA+ superfamily predicted ATPase
MLNKFKHEVVNRWRACFGYSFWVTDEIQEAVKVGKDLAREEAKVCKAWTVTEGWGNGTTPSRDPIQATVTALREITGFPGEGLYLLNSTGGVWFKNPFAIQTMLDILPDLKANGKHVAFIGPKAELPPEVAPFISELDFPLPTPKENEAIIYGLLNQDMQYRSEDVSKLAKELCGLPRGTVEDISALLITETGGITSEGLPKAQELKANAFAKDGILEIMQPDPAFAEIGGHGNFKMCVWETSQTFSEEAREAGIEAPGGFLLLGPSGVGKTYAVRWMQWFFRCQLAKLDLGRVYGRYVGESEARIRSVLKTLEAMAANSQVIFMIDEFEKAMAGMGSDGDSGVASRVGGTLLQWMQDIRHRDDVNIITVLTCNDIAKLPPEMTRYGRIDAKFFMWFPTAKERQEIIAIHLRKRGKDPAMFNLGGLAAACRNFSGAEIEEGIRRANRQAFCLKKDLTNQIILDAFQQINPIAEMQSDKYQKLKDEWGRYSTPSSIDEEENISESAPVRRLVRGW